MGKWQGSAREPFDVCSIFARMSRNVPALNPRVRGSSPWRRTRSDLVLFHLSRLGGAGGMGRGWPGYGRPLRQACSRAAGQGFLSPPRLGACRRLAVWSCDLPAALGVAESGGNHGVGVVAQPPPSGATALLSAGDQAARGDDQRGDVLSHLSGGLRKYRGIGVGG